MRHRVSEGELSYTPGMEETVFTRFIFSAEAPRLRWRNDAGWTRELHLQPAVEAAADWDWRLSIAEIERRAAFSSFPGMTRELLLLQGGLELCFDDSEPTCALKPFDRRRFDGEASVSGDPGQERALACNLIWRRGGLTVDTWQRPLVGNLLCAVAPGQTWVIVVLSGHARLQREREPELGPMDAAILTTGDQTRQVFVEGAGQLLLARLGAGDPARTASSKPADLGFQFPD